MQGVFYPDNVLPRLHYQFCPMCATPLVSGVTNDDGISRVYCPDCGWVHYPTNVTIVCTLVKYGDKLVAILPPECPAEMPAALPAGHGEYGESPEQAAIREAYEETGLVVEIDRCLGWYFNPLAEYPGPYIAFMFEAHAVGGELRGSEEGQVAVYSLDQFPLISPVRINSHRTMQAYRERLRQEPSMNKVQQSNV
jgi:ADP-ribose pyrophosphatase YjhB (NUDIX family)